MISYKNSNGVWTTAGVHRIVATAFCENSNNYPEVNHIDFNRKNNVATNLEWVTHKQNVQYSHEHYRHFGENNSNYGNTKLSKYYSEHPEIALQKQSRKGLQNGRCRKISMYYQGDFVKSFEYISLCCQWLIDHNVAHTKNIESVRGRIDSSIRNNKAYKGYTFEKK